MTEIERRLRQLEDEAVARSPLKVALDLVDTATDPKSMSLEEAVFIALGAASMCWDPVPVGNFDFVRCRTIGDELLEAIKILMPLENSSK